MRERVFPILRDFDSYAKYFHEGFYYAHGRDRKMRPIVVLNSRRWVDSGIDLTSLLSLVDIMSNYMIEVATIPGRIETWHTIIDIRGLSMWEMPIAQGGMVAVHLNKINFARSATLHFTNVPKMAELAARFIYNFLDEFNREKMMFWGDSYKPKFK